MTALISIYIIIHIVHVLEFIEEMNEKLIESAYDDDLEGVKYALKNGADIKYDNSKAYIVAAQYGYVDVLQYLIQKDSSAKVRDYYALRIAIKTGSLDNVKYFIKNGMLSSYDRELNLAASNGRLNVVKYLLENIVEINGNSELLRAAAGGGHTEVVQYLIDCGFHVTDLSSTALKWASKKNHIDVVKLLLEDIVYNHKERIKDALGVLQERHHFILKSLILKGNETIKAESIDESISL